MTQQLDTILKQLNTKPLRMGEVKKLAATIKKNHALAMQLWQTGLFAPRLLAALIMDKAELTQEVIDQLATDLEANSYDERNRISEWVMAHQLMKSKKTLALLESWADHPSAVLRRLYWYHQGRLRWTGKGPTEGTPQILAAIEKSLATEAPEVQWAMNFTAAWIGVYQPEYRDAVVAMGEEIGLYKEEKAVKGCTPNYIPEFVRIEVAKRA